MKKLHCLFTAVLVAGIGLFAEGCKDEGKDIDKSLQGTETRSLATLADNTLHIVRTQKEYDEFAKNSGDSLPPEVDFTKYSLLVVKVTAPNGVALTYTDITRVEARKYLFNVDIELNDAAVVQRLVITSLTPALGGRDIVELKLNMSHPKEEPVIPGENAKFKDNTLYTIRSAAEWEDAVTELELLFPEEHQLSRPVDFSGNSVLLVKGILTSGYENPIARELIKNANGDYTFSVTIRRNAATVVLPWMITDLVPAISPEETVSLNLSIL